MALTTIDVAANWLASSGGTLPPTLSGLGAPTMLGTSATMTPSTLSTVFRPKTSRPRPRAADPAANAHQSCRAAKSAANDPGNSGGRPRAGARSEEHTSELQARENLVCRLLL